MLRIRHYHLRQKQPNLYYKCSPSTNTIKSSSNEKIQNQLTRKFNYDDMTSMGSYVYPITSSTSLLHTSSPSSLFKSEQYAFIDGTSCIHYPLNNVKMKRSKYR